MDDDGPIEPWYGNIDDLVHMAAEAIAGAQQVAAGALPLEAVFPDDDTTDDFVLNVPYALRTQGRADLAVDFAESVAPIVPRHRIALDAQRAVALGQLGRTDEVRDLVRRLAASTRDFLVAADCAEALEAIGDHDDAGGLHRRAVALAERHAGPFEAASALEGLIGHVERHDGVAEAAPLRARRNALIALDAHQREQGSGGIRHLHHPGRNDPCSCGSGRKYKRCCGG